MATMTEGRLPHGWGVWKFALKATALTTAAMAALVGGYVIVASFNRNTLPILPAQETPTPTRMPTQTPVPPIATPDISTEALQAVYDPLTGLSVAALIRNNSNDYDAHNIEVTLNYGNQQQTRPLPLVERNGIRTVDFTGIRDFKPGDNITIEAILTPTANQHDPNEANNTTGSIGVIYIPAPPTPSPTPTLRPKDTPTPTYTPKPATPTPTKQPPTPTSTPKPPTPTPTPSLEDITKSVIEQNPAIMSRVQSLADYDKSYYKKPETQQLAKLLQVDAKLVERTLVAAQYLNTPGQTEWEKFGSKGVTTKDVLNTLELVLWHRGQNNGNDVPSGGRATFPTALVILDYLTTQGELTLSNGVKVDRREYALSSPATKTALVSLADIWDVMALPDGGIEYDSATGKYTLHGLATVPNWAVDSYCPEGQRDYSNPCQNALLEASTQTIFAGPYSTNASADIRFSAAPVLKGKDDKAFDDAVYNDPKFDSVREQWLQMIDFQPNASVKDLQAFAEGRLQDTKLRLDYRGKRDLNAHLDQSDLSKLGLGMQIDWSKLTVQKIDERLERASEYVLDLDLETRAFIVNTGNLQTTMNWSEFDKSQMYIATLVPDGGPFRGIYSPSVSTRLTNGRLVFPEPNDKNIRIYASGVTFRVNDMTSRLSYQPEMFGFMKVTPEGASPEGNYEDGYLYVVSNNGEEIAAGERVLVPDQPLKYPFVDVEKTGELWSKGAPARVPTLRSSRGVNFLLNPAKISGVDNPADSEYQQRGPWVLVFDNRSGKAVGAGAGDSLTNAVFKPSSSGLLLPDYKDFNLGYTNDEDGFVPLYIPQQTSQQLHWTGVRRELEKISLTE